ncbi:MAG: hypothetical protein ABSD11_15605 [Methylocella sp.]|jgi:hypothetical protein
MAYITTGLTNGGVTTHYRFSYDQALSGPGGPEPARTNAVIAACENDYNLMHSWFGGGVNVTGMNVQVTTQSNGASWSGTASNSTIQLKAQGASYSNNAAYLRYLIIAEVVEIFMMAQGIGWFQGSNEGSKGEGLSRFLSGQFLAENGYLGLGIDASYAVADLWLNSSRQDFVNNAPDDNGDDATNGCTTLFIYYLFSQLGYSINKIVAAGSSTLAGVYKNLTGDSSDPFPLFENILNLWFPSTTNSAVTGPNFDDPWPLSPIAYTGVWRSGSEPYYLWIHAPQNDFLNKWQTLASQNLRLTDIEVTTLNGQTLFSGIWEQGTDGYYLWINANESSFIAKWQELAAQNLRLVSIKQYNGLWAGVWRSGSDSYYLWIDADQANFLAKWQELAAQGLRLIDFDVYTVNGQTLWAGVWRAGTDGYYLWINADWTNFQAKWAELADQNLRLIAVQNYNGLWAGAWRSGTDAYYLWANVSEASFLAKWQELGAQNLRLIDMEAIPVARTGGAVAGVSGMKMMVTGEQFGVSQLQIGRRAGAVTALQGSASVGQGGGYMPSVVASNVSAPAMEAGTASGAVTGGGSVAEPLVVEPVMATSGAAMGGGSPADQAELGGQGGGSVPSMAASRAAMAEMAIGEGGGSAPGATASRVAMDGAKAEAAIGQGGGNALATTSDASARSGSSALRPRSTENGGRSRKKLTS